MPWSIYIGCHQGHSTGLVMPSQDSHPLTPVECFALGWIFHSTDRGFLDSFLKKASFDMAVTLCILCMRMMVDLVTSRREQEQENPGNMTNMFMLS